MRLSAAFTALPSVSSAATPAFPGTRSKPPARLPRLPSVVSSPAPSPRGTPHAEVLAAAPRTLQSVDWPFSFSLLFGRGPSTLRFETPFKSFAAHRGHSSINAPARRQTNGPAARRHPAQPQGQIADSSLAATARAPYRRAALRVWVFGRA